MANKKSYRKVIHTFLKELDDQESFVQRAADAGLSGRPLTLVYEMSLIKLVSAVELLVLDSMVTAINRDPAAVGRRAGVRIPSHLTDDMCEYLIIRNGYFSFGNRSDLLKRVRDVLPADHWLVQALQESIQKESFDRMMALRHYAAHGSQYSRKKAKEQVGAKRLSTAGAWYASERRHAALVRSLRHLGRELEAAAPF